MLPRPRSLLTQGDGKPPSWGQRLEALKYVPPLLRLVYQTHRGYTVAILALRAIRSFVPLAVLWIGKLIIDGVIGAARARTGGVPVDWWHLLLLVVAVLPSFLGETHYAALGYSLLFQWTPERRLLDYLRYVGASDEMAKEVKLFSLSDFLVGRYAKLSDEFYEANKRLAVKRNLVSTLFVTIGTLGYYGAYAVTIYLTVLGRFTIGALTFLAGSVRQSRDLIQRILLSVSQVFEQSLYLSDLFTFFHG